ncbi:unnamed protein product [Enterobius vermicularis]|uniref:Secreted protein n=1 Tax=Enterobius vermicularis TaxID=51028 RepID=A0A0N4VPQ7_ENTVE|nr:unnamed protein product [Enterobius vermicularis]
MLSVRLCLCVHLFPCVRRSVYVCVCVLPSEGVVLAQFVNNSFCVLAIFDDKLSVVVVVGGGIGGGGGGGGLVWFVLVWFGHLIKDDENIDDGIIADANADADTDTDAIADTNNDDVDVDSDDETVQTY